MMAPAATRLAPVTLRPARDEDAHFTQVLCRERASEEFAHLPLDVETLDELVTMQVDAQDVSYRAQFPGASHSIVECGAASAGRLILHSTDRRLHLVDVCLLRHFRGRGIGTCVIRMLQDVAAVRETPLTLSARRDGRAHLLYERLGFATVGGSELDQAMVWNPQDVTG